MPENLSKKTKDVWDNGIKRSMEYWTVTRSIYVQYAVI